MKVSITELTTQATTKVPCKIQKIIINLRFNLQSFSAPFRIRRNVDFSTRISDSAVHVEFQLLSVGALDHVPEVVGLANSVQLVNGKRVYHVCRTSLSMTSEPMMYSLSAWRPARSAGDDGDTSCCNRAVCVNDDNKLCLKTYQNMPDVLVGSLE